MSDSPQPDPAPSQATQGSEIVPRGRGCLGSLVSTGCGCFAFLAGAGLAVALFGAHLMSGWGARAIESYIGQFVEGSVEVTGVELAWSEPQIVRSVTILSPEPEARPVVQAKLKLPSLLDLFGDRIGERAFGVQILSLQSRVDADGTSDLGRTFGLVADDGRTVAHALQERVFDVLSRIKEDVDQSSLRVEILVTDGRIDDSASGRGVLEIDELSLVATASRIDARFELRECVLRGAGLEGAAEPYFDLRFAYEDDGRLRLAAGALNAPPIPRSVLRTMGVVSRGARATQAGDPRRRRDTLDVVGDRGLDGVVGLLAGGAAVEARFGPPGKGEQPRLSLRLRGEDLDVDFDATLTDDGLVPAELEDGRDPLQVLLRRGPESLESFFGALTPDGVAIASPQDEVVWSLTSPSFRFPLSARDLVFDDSSGDSRTPGERIADTLRRTEMTAYLRNAGPPARVHFDAGPDHREPWEVLDWAHRITTLELRGDLGGTLESAWRADQGPRPGTTLLSVALPGRSLGPYDDPVATLDVTLPGMTRALMEAAAPLPPELRALLPERLFKLDVRGIPLSRFLRPGRRDRMRVAVDVWTDRDVAFRGRFENGIFRVPSASVGFAMSPQISRGILERVLPWLAEIEPLDPSAEIRIELRDFEFREVDGEFREEGEAIIECAPLRVKLRPSLASKFVVDSEDGWIEWTPAPIVLSLETNVVRYRKVELPLGDVDEPSRMTGTFDREEGKLDLTGLVDSRLIPGTEEGGLLPVEVKIGGKLDDLETYFPPDFLERALQGLREKVVPGGGG